MVTAILDISEAESRAMKLNLQPLKIEELFSEVLDLYEPVAEEEKHLDCYRIVWECPSDRPW